MKTSIVILTFNKLEYTKKCIESIRKYTPESHEIIVIDNNSSDRTQSWIKEQKDLRYIFNNENLGFPKGCNQGIELSTGDNILLLNNDVVVTKSWLSNLLVALNSDECVGAAGPVTNSSAYYQSIAVKYKSLDEMQTFSTDFNKSDSSKWEERQKLIGFCILIKRKVIDEIGMLDTIFTPGNYEDDDFCIRMIEKGYKLLLCKDTFIHHYGGTSFKENKAFTQLLLTNEIKFKNKWRFTSRENMNIYFELADTIKEENKSNFKILELGCGTGATLLYLKNKYPNAEFYGWDDNKQALRICGKFAKVILGELNDFGDMNNSICKSINTFDYLLIGDAAARLNNLETVFEIAKLLLKPKGKLLVSVNNDNYIDNVMIKIKDKESILKENKNIEYILNCLVKLDFSNIDGIKIKSEFNDEEKKYYNSAIENTKDLNIEDILIKKYVFVAENKKNSNTNSNVENNGMEELFANIDNEVNIEENIIKILELIKTSQLSVDNTINLVDKSVSKKALVLNLLAISCYSNELFEYVIPLLNKALEYEPDNDEILSNFGMILFNIGEYELSKQYLGKVNNKNKDIEELIVEIDVKYLKEKHSKERTLKYILRRIENEIELEQSIETIINYINKSEYTVDEITNSIDINIIKKVELLNLIGVKLFEQELYDEVIPYLQKAYEYKPDDFDTNYNLGYVLNFFGEKELALSYFASIKNIDAETDKFISSIEGK